MFCCDVGGGGRANGFGGPETPADKSAEADGEGGGRSIPLCGRSVFADLFPEAPRGEPEPDSFSSDSDGMVRLSLGRAAPLLEPFVSDLLGGPNSDVADVVVVARVGCAGVGRANNDPG